jgi:hypothetical protein
MKEMSQKCNCSVHKVAYWMNKYKIARRTRDEANYLKYNPNGDPFVIKTKLNPDEQFLKGLGLGIYWGEGAKTSEHSLRVANTDVGIIRAFRRFLLNICGLREDKISYSLICFNDVDPNIARNYWAKELGILPHKFGKITIIPKQGKGTYKRKSTFGVCTIQASNIKLREWMMKELGQLDKSLISSTAERILGKNQMKVRLSHQAQTIKQASPKE